MIAGEQFFLTNKEKRNTHDYNIKNNLKILVRYIDKNKKTNLIYMMYSLVWLIVSFCISSYITIFFNEMIFFLNKQSEENINFGSLHIKIISIE